MSAEVEKLRHELAEVEADNVLLGLKAAALERRLYAEIAQQVAARRNPGGVLIKTKPEDYDPGWRPSHPARPFGPTH